jgi:hypothetical protein
MSTFPIGKTDPFGWAHSRVGSGSTGVSLDFQPIDDTDGDTATFTAKNAWLNVTGVASGSKVEAIVTDYLGSPTDGNPFAKNDGFDGRSVTVKVALNDAGNGRYTAPLPNLDIGNANHGGSFLDSQTVKVVVNGQQVNDPITGGDFVISLGRAAGL